MLTPLKQAWARHSDGIWIVNSIHLLWGYIFLTWESLPRPFGGIEPFIDNPTFWGITFIVVSLLSFASDFIGKTWYRLLLIPQQTVVTYAAIWALMNLDTPRLIMAACYTIPIAIAHITALLRKK